MPTAFLWGGGTAAPDVEAFHPRRDAWWSQYSDQLAGSMSKEARAELRRAARTIVGLLPDPLAWGARARPARGLVVGAIQSGKTASMMGVAATALDHGFRVVVILAGGKDDLRRQTARRFNTQLLLQSDRIPESGGSRTAPIRPQPLGGFGLPFAQDAHQYGLLYPEAQKVLDRGEPLILTIKKNVVSLQEVRSVLGPTLKRLGTDAVPTLVLDDECDDASVDASGAAVPLAIEELWDGHAAAPPFAYVGYTATAAANLLQHPENALFPADFVVLLRTPDEEATPLSFAEPSPDRWYTGGGCFMAAFGEVYSEEANFLVRPCIEPGHLATAPAENPSLRDAVRAYLVSGAYRLVLSGAQLDGEDAVPAAALFPHTMLVQTSAARSEHRRWAEGVRQMLGGEPLADQSVPLSAHKIQADLEDDEAGWRGWYEAFARSRERVYAERPHSGVERHATWAQVRAALTAVGRSTRLRVVNSDEDVGASLDFSPRIGTDGERLPARDTFAIVFGGAKLSRGLTLEGLCISYFSRWSATPMEDTVLQLCRWYGYRGKHLEFCRLFTTAEIAEELRGVHENDTALRYQLADLMVSGTSPRDAAIVIASNARALPTGKLGTGVVRDVAFSPYSSVFRHLEIGSLAEQNEAVALSFVQALRERGAEEALSGAGKLRGIISRGWAAGEVADWLDSLAYSDHNPDQTANPARDHYRCRDDQRAAVEGRRFDDDPYQIAAYLREWAARRSEVGSPPTFNLAVAYGEKPDHTAPFDFPLLNRDVSGSGELQSQWTGRSAHWRGDAFFDAPPPPMIIPGSSLRREGAEGLLLLYVIHRNAQGRQGTGATRLHHTPTFGVVIPAGGPAFRRVIADHRRVGRGGSSVHATMSEGDT
jgi:hypothetical protein